MLYSEEFLASLGQDPINGALQVVELARSNFDDEQEYTQKDYETLLEAYALILGMQEADLLSVALPVIDVGATRSKVCISIFQALNAVEERCTALAAKAKVDSLKARFRTSLGTSFHYEFSQGDLQRIQLLINDLRELIAASDALETAHQQRLLARLEKLQTEMHKKVSDLDRFWGLIGDASVALAKLGNAAKPIVECVKEITQIVWQTQARAEELPSGTSLPLLDRKQDT